MKISFDLIHSSFELELEDDISASSIEIQDSVKREVLKAYGFKDVNNNLNNIMNNYSLITDFEPKCDQNQLVKDWIKKNEKAKCILKLIPNKKYESATDIICSSILNIIQINPDSILMPMVDHAVDKVIYKIREENEKQIEEMKKDKQETIEGVKKEHEKQIEEMKKDKQETIEGMKKELQGFFREMKANENIHCLANFVSLFRYKIIRKVNELNGKNYNSWIELKNGQNSEKQIKNALEQLELRYDYWENMSNLAKNLNSLKDEFILPSEALDLLENIKGTKYEKYYNSLRQLILLFDKNNWDDN